MAEEKAPRTPAGDVGTDHRIDTGYGLYWVRLTTRGAIIREGECMSNCCRHGSYFEAAGPEALGDTALWSLRREADRVSIALARIDEIGNLDEFKGPMNNQPSGLAYRSLRQLREYMVAGGATLDFPYGVVVDDEGNTYRPDKVPQHVREAIAAKEAAERKAREEVNKEYLRQARERNPEAFHLQPGEVMIRPQGADSWRSMSDVLDLKLDFRPVRYQARQGLRQIAELQTRFEFRGADAIARACWEMREHALAAVIRGEPHQPEAFPSRAERQQRPALPDLLTLPSSQARMRAVRENQQARLADRQWIRDNERAQRRLAR